MSSEQRFQAVDAIATEVVDGELVLLQLHDGVYFGLDPLGTRIWDRLVAGWSLTQISADLCTAYPSESPDALQVDLHALVRELVTANLLRSRESGVS
jgi:hypothetical protein